MSQQTTSNNIKRHIYDWHIIIPQMPRSPHRPRGLIPTTAFSFVSSSPFIYTQTHTSPFHHHSQPFRSLCFVVQAPKFPFYPKSHLPHPFLKFYLFGGLILNCAAHKMIPTKHGHRFFKFRGARAIPRSLHSFSAFWFPKLSHLGTLTVIAYYLPSNTPWIRSQESHVCKSEIIVCFLFDSLLLFYLCHHSSTTNISLSFFCQIVHPDRIFLIFPTFSLLFLFGLIFSKKKKENLIYQSKWFLIRSTTSHVRL